MSSNDCQALLNCPFCGGEGKLKEADGILDDFTMFCCYCPNGKCIAGGTDWFRSREEAIESWNTMAERTCKFSRCFDDEDQLPTCSACGYEADASEILVKPGGELIYEYDWCVGCGAKVMEK